MTWFFAILVVLALGGIALVAAGRGAPMVRAYDDRPDALVPADRPLGADDLRRVRFSLALRGYRMSEVDALLERLATEREVAHEPGSRPTAAVDEDVPGVPHDQAHDQAHNQAHDQAHDQAPGEAHGEGPTG